LRLGWLATPVFTASACFFLVEGTWLYPAAAIGAGSSILALAGAFRLFHIDDAVFLKELRLTLPFRLGDGSPVGSRL
jgi:hypothetical protein